jgi:nitrogen fixation protein FixH
MAEITGRHVLAITVGAFGLIIAVNVVMAWKAISTFPGLEVENSYVASQEFDRREARRKSWAGRSTTAL